MYTHAQRYFKNPHSGVTDSEFQTDQLCSSAGAFSHLYRNFKGDISVAKQYVSFSRLWLHSLLSSHGFWHAALWSAVLPWQKGSCMHSIWVSGPSKSIRGDGCCSVLTLEWTGHQRLKSPGLAALSDHRENLLSLLHINGQGYSQQQQQKKGHFLLPLHYTASCRPLLNPCHSFRLPPVH